MHQDLRVLMQAIIIQEEQEAPKNLHKTPIAVDTDKKVILRWKVIKKQTMM